MQLQDRRVLIPPREFQIGCFSNSSTVAPKCQQITNPSDHLRNALYIPENVEEGKANRIITLIFSLKSST